MFSPKPTHQDSDGADLEDKSDMWDVSSGNIMCKGSSQRSHLVHDDLVRAMAVRT